MKEITKYSSYRFVGKINIDEIMPWFDFDKSKPWDEMEVPWVLENKVRRQILIILANAGPKTFDELLNYVNFSPNPLLISRDEHVPSVKYQWNKDTIENHLLNLEWYNLIRKENDKYLITFPVFSLENLEDINKYIIQFAENWIKIIRETNKEVKKHLRSIEEKTPLYEILVEKAVEKLYSLLKSEGLLPNEPNIKALWAEQLRKIKFEDWVDKNF